MNFDKLNKIAVDVEEKFTIYLPQRIQKLFEEDTDMFQQMKQSSLNGQLYMMFLGGMCNNMKFMNSAEV